MNEMYQDVCLFVLVRAKTGVVVFNVVFETQESIDTFHTTNLIHRLEQVRWSKNRFDVPQQELVASSSLRQIVLRGHGGSSNSRRANDILIHSHRLESVAYLLVAQT